MDTLRNTKGENIYISCHTTPIALVEQAKRYVYSLTDVDLRGMDLCGLDLSYTNLSRANLSRANLPGAMFFLSTLKRVDFSDANLTGADFRKSVLHGSVFAGAELTGALFKGALIERRNLVGAKISGVTVGPAIEALPYSTLSIRKSASIAHWEQIKKALEEGPLFLNDYIIIDREGNNISTSGYGCPYCVYYDGRTGCPLGPCDNCCGGIWNDFQEDPTPEGAAAVIEYIENS